MLAVLREDHGIDVMTLAAGNWSATHRRNCIAVGIERWITTTRSPFGGIQTRASSARTIGVPFARSWTALRFMCRGLQVWASAKSAVWLSLHHAENLGRTCQPDCFQTRRLLAVGFVVVGASSAATARFGATAR